ncbi:hypothetical protein P691DRAFT_791918 [Macrolepiota fuliginosa MF-IS2]|uniref:Uncharacterized protein n=1 Tax=Macrolepiota fuliginosa MF-IS2 TaxID=1400762 RepID=A0A9P6BX86_9AGAR|nr:hypothetical protein P691DRAFT_791918 [Macrolepiota fuliginosa MF-IS2]
MRGVLLFFAWLGQVLVLLGLVLPLALTLILLQWFVMLLLVLVLVLGAPLLTPLLVLPVGVASVGKGVLKGCMDSGGNEGDGESQDVGTVLEKQSLPHCNPGIRDSHQDHHGLKGARDLQTLVLQSHHVAHPLGDLLRGVMCGGKHKVLDELDV